VCKLSDEIKQKGDSQTAIKRFQYGKRKRINKKGMN
jgi:hypothetical protein